MPIVYRAIGDCRFISVAALGLEIKQWIKIRHPVDQDGRLVRVGSVAGQHIGGRKRLHAGQNSLPPESAQHGRADKPPASLAI